MSNMMSSLNLSTDFWKGALAVVGLATVRAIYQLFQYPSIDEMERVANAPVKQLGDDTIVTVYGFFDDSKDHRFPHYKRGVTDPSFYVLRVECFCRLNGIPYTKKAITPDPKLNPRRKLPFANVQGTMVDDSSRIIDLLKSKFQKDPDDKLTDLQRATGLVIRHTMFGELYWICYYLSVCTKQGHKMSAENWFGSVPPVIKQLVTASVFRGMYRSLDGQGVSRMPSSLIASNGRNVVWSLNQLLGKNQYILGTAQPTTFDCDVYAMLIILFYDEPLCDEPWVVQIKKDCPNLVAYVDRLKDAWFPELKQA